METETNAPPPDEDTSAEPENDTVPEPDAPADSDGGEDERKP